MNLLIHEQLTWDARTLAVPPALLGLGRAILRSATEEFSALPGVNLLRSDWSPPGVRDWLAWGKGRGADAVLGVAPEAGGRLLALAQSVRAAGLEWWGCEPEAIRLAGDKFLLAAHLDRSGVPTPETRLADEFAAAPVFPAVLKPRDGAGSLETVRVTDAGEFLRYLDAAGPSANIVAQPFIEGQMVSCSVLAGGGKVWALPPSRQLVATDGTFAYLGGTFPIEERWSGPARRLAAEAVSSLPGARGYLGVDLILDNSGRMWVLEINPRLSASFPGLRLGLGGRLAPAIVAALNGDVPSKLEWQGPTTEFRIDEFLNSSPDIQLAAVS